MASWLIICGSLFGNITPYNKESKVNKFNKIISFIFIIIIITTFIIIIIIFIIINY